MSEVKVLQVLYTGAVSGVNDRLSWSRRTGRAFQAESYRAFKEALAWAIKKEMGICTPWPFPVDPPLKVTIRADLPSRMDLDAIIKPCFDALELAGAVKNDIHIEALCIERCPGCAPPGEYTIELALWQL
jgi:Holliday junction resolvase RusA-like endonuclease